MGSLLVRPDKGLPRVSESQAVRFAKKKSVPSVSAHGYTTQPLPSAYALSWRKRGLDVLIAVAGLALTASIAPVVALAILLNSPSWMLYRQTRVGLRGKLFAVNKFRTMFPGAEPDGRAVWAEKGDRRATAVGRVLRRMYIDELPQFWNVLIGDMSIVGPRPERPDLSIDIAKSVDRFRFRTRIRPGITGIAQIFDGYGNSTRGATREAHYDCFYVRHASFGMDLAIMARTIRHLLHLNL